jgi:adenylate kinase family enzyme
MLDKPSKNYLIDGFPRALDQALHFEATVTEAQAVLFYDVSEEECIARCMERAKTSGRADDTESTIKKRFSNYVESTKPAIEMYTHFGKVHKINGERDINEIYEDTRKALLPQTAWILGPRGSGKSSIGNALSSCTNMKLIDFIDFVKSESLEGKDDETVVSALIKRLSEEVCPRVLIENFPKNDFQAKFFMKNGRAPSQVFALKCSKDVC